MSPCHVLGLGGTADQCLAHKQPEGAPCTGEAPSWPTYRSHSCEILDKCQESISVPRQRPSSPSPYRFTETEADGTGAGQRENGEREERQVVVDCDGKSRYWYDSRGRLAGVSSPWSAPVTIE